MPYHSCEHIRRLALLSPTDINICPVSILNHALYMYKEKMISILLHNVFAVNYGSHVIRYFHMQTVSNLLQLVPRF